LAFVFDFKALGTGVRVLTTIPEMRADAIACIKTELDAIDAACSRFRTDSELSRLNRANGHAMDVSDLFIEALQAAIRAAELTDGLVSPTVGEAMRRAGYDRDFAELEESQESSPPAPPRPVPDWRALFVDRGRSTARLAAGVEIDLGATAKALAADRAAALAARVTGGGVLVSIGGDLSIAGGPPEGGWKVLVAEDHAAPPSVAGEQLHLNSGGLATSSTTVRNWTRGHERMHHILDPATGLPARVYWRTATVGAATCLDANIAATAAIVMGPTAPSWLEAHGLPARLVGRDGRIRPVGAWPAGAAVQRPW
jgi:thiamine biosynthesis lipoprotein